MLRQNEEMVAVESAQRVGWIHIALLAGILVGATLLRVHALGKTSYWYDEIASVLYARGQTAVIFAVPQGYFAQAPALASQPATRGWGDIWFGFDTTPPLYPTLLRVWWHLFGQSDIAGRSFSVAASVLTVAAMFDLGRLMMSPAAALWACALCAASPPMVRYAQEARAYALLGLLGVLICDVAVRLERFGGSARRYVLLWVLCAASLLTHNFIVGGLAALMLFCLIRLRGRTRLIAMCLVAASFVVELWELPILLHHSQNLHQGIDWLEDHDPGLLLRTFKTFAWLPVVYLVFPMGDPSLVYVPALVVFVLPLFAFKRRVGWLLAGLWPVGIIGLVAASDLWLSHNASLYVRYTLAAAPMVFICFAGIGELAGKWIKHALPALAVAGALLAVPEAYSAQTWIKPEARELAADIAQHVQPGDVLVVASRPTMGLYAAGTKYLEIDFYKGPLPCAVAILEAPPDAKVRAEIWSHPRVWWVECFGGAQGNGGADASQYLGPCKLVREGILRLHAGQLFLAEKVPD